MTDSIELSQRILTNDSYKSLFDDEQLEEIKTQATPEVTELPPLLLNNDWGVSLTTYNRMYYCTTFIYLFIYIF